MLQSLQQIKVKKKQKKKTTATANGCRFDKQNLI